MAAVVKARRPGALISAATAIMFGMAAPKPKPASKRTAHSCTGVCTSEVAKVNSAKDSTAMVNTGLRPSRSANQPPMLAPMTRPILLNANTQPFCSGCNPNSGDRRGMATPST